MQIRAINISALELITSKLFKEGRYWVNIALAVICIVGVTGCDLHHLHYTDCRYYDGPRFNKTSLDRAILNQEYSENVRVSFDDDRHIDSLTYQFEFSGNLPPGISSYRDNRNIHFEGTATMEGVYSYAITVRARYKIYDRLYFNEHRDYCSYQTTQNYLLFVDLGIVNYRTITDQR